MDVIHAIEERRAFRSLEPVRITEDLIRDLVRCAGLAPSCNNNQPWRFVFVHDSQSLANMQEALSKGNEWAYSASLIISFCDSHSNRRCPVHHQRAAKKWPDMS